MSQDVTVDVTLVGGQTHQAVLPSDSQILHDLHVALATGAGSRAGAEDGILQLPIDGGHAACTFMASSVVSVTTRPPVVLTPMIGAAPGRRAAPNYLRIDDFLTPDENALLFQYAIEQEPAFQTSGTLGGSKSYRRSKVLYAIRESHWQELFMSRLKLHLPHIAGALGKPDFRLVDYEMQLTASNDGDYFRAHADASPEHHRVAAREITFVYYLHRTPRPYNGGGLLLYDGAPGQPTYDRGADVRLIDPQNNCLIAFTSDSWHEVDMIRCPSLTFADSRFTVNGWLRQEAMPA
jgi:Rps23 Pro-64 3,4-dihydroxylase Tpa1-like proline 4-hydroxylase